MNGSKGSNWPSMATGTIASLMLATALATPAVSADMTADRATNVDAEPQNWILHHRNYEGTRHSPLDEINAGNVGGLKVAYILGLQGIEGAGRFDNGSLEGTPLVEDGMMYFPNGWGLVYKVDVSSGTSADPVWVMDPATDRAWAADVACCGVNNRGVAFWQDKIISISLDGRLIATDKDTGEIAWERTIADPAKAETLTVAPLIVGDTAIVGPAGAEYGIRGFLDATDLNTGKQKWRTFTVAGPDDPIGGPTWGGNATWETGGGSIWVTAVYDADADLMYWGTGNPGPDWDAEYRPGDNLYTDSVLAMKPQTGTIEWFFQYTPNDPYDYDEIGPHFVLDANYDGTSRKALVHPGRNGFYYAFDRLSGELLVVEPYVDLINWTPGIDAKTGLPLNYDPNTPVQAYDAIATARRTFNVAIQCPLITGGNNWEPAAYNPDLQLMYTQGGEGCHQRVTVIDPDPTWKGGSWKYRDRFVGGRAPNDEEKALPLPPGTTIAQRGSIKAINVVSGETVARVDTLHFNRSGMLSTAGGIVMNGSYEGVVYAYDSSNMNQLWSFSVGSSIKAPPITYSVGGKQYIALLVGAAPGGTQKRDQPSLNHFAPVHMLIGFTL